MADDRRRECRKDDPNWMWPCSCDDCARAAASAWTGLMSQVHDGQISLDEANHRADGMFGR